MWGVVGDRCLKTPSGPGFWTLISSTVCGGCHGNGPLNRYQLNLRDLSYTVKVTEVALIGVFIKGCLIYKEVVERYFRGRGGSENQDLTV